MSIPATSNLKQATGPTKTAGLTRYDATCRALPGSREDRIIHWLRGVSRDSRIGVLHRFALIGIGLDRACVLRAIDIGVRRGWLLAEDGGLGGAFTFPPGQGAAVIKTGGAA